MVRFGVGALALGLLAVAPGSAFAATAAKASACDRECLRGVTDAYMQAVFKHDPKAAPLGPNYRQTINALESKAGQAIWNTATGYGPIQRRFADPTTGNALYFGHLMEGAVQDVVGVRLKVVNRKVTEAEWVVARKTDGTMFSSEGLSENVPPGDGPIPVADRSTRAAMIAAGDAYFDALGSHDGSKIPHIAGCERVEDGFKVTNRARGGPPPPPIPGAAPAPTGAAPSAAEESRSGDCASGMEGFAKTIVSAGPRRYLVVDEVAGMALGQTVLNRPPGATIKRNLIDELFFVKNGKISGIWVAMYYVAPEVSALPNWP